MIPEIPQTASLEEVRNYMTWMDAIVSLGWEKKDHKALSDLWWKYHPTKWQYQTSPVEPEEKRET